MENAIIISKNRRWEILTGAFILGAIMMYAAFILINKENICRTNEWKIVLLGGSVYFFIWPAIFMSGIILEGDKFVNKPLESQAGRPRYKILRNVVTGWVIVLGLIITFLRTVFHIHGLIKEGQCDASNHTYLVWQAVYPGLIWTGIAAILVWLGFTFLYKRK